MVSLSLKPLDPRLIYFVSEDIQIPIKEWETSPPFLPTGLNVPAGPLELPEMCQMAAHYFVKTLENPEISHDHLKKKIKLALALCLTFLNTNQIQVKVSEIDLYQTALDVGYDEFSESEFSDFLLENAQGPSLQAKWSLSSETLQNKPFP